MAAVNMSRMESKKSGSGVGALIAVVLIGIGGVAAGNAHKVPHPHSTKVCTDRQSGAINEANRSFDTGPACK